MFNKGVSRVQQGRRITRILLLLSFLMILVILSLGTGAATFVLDGCWDWVVGTLRGDLVTLDPLARAVFFQIRLPRVVLGLLVGGTLGCAGALTQAIFRNPLAAPGLIGVSSGASLGAAICIVFLPMIPLPLGAFLGSLCVTALVVSLARRGYTTDIQILLLLGIAVNALVGAMLGFLIYSADDTQLRDLTFWTLGSLSGVEWEKILYVLPMQIICLGFSMVLAKSLNALSLGENHAMFLGFHVERIKIYAFLLITMQVGVGVAITGMIGFIGLVGPHIARLLVGADHRYSILTSALMGALLLVAADALSRVIVAPAEMPVGILTSLLGAPFFISLIKNSRRGGAAC